MPLSSYRMHRIYLAANMVYGLGSDDFDELAYYNKIRKELRKLDQEIKKDGGVIDWKRMLNDFI